jgi:hypothetical protein
MTLVVAAPAFAAVNFVMVASPNIGALHNELHAVSAITGTEMFAVGEHFTGTWDRGLIEKGNGTTWTATSAPVPASSTHNQLNAVGLANATLGWAVGTFSRAKSSFDLVEKYSAGKWSITSIPNPLGITSNVLNGLAVGSKSSVVAVGADHATARPPKPTSYFFNGTSWRAVAVPNPGKIGTKTFSATLYGAAVVPGSSGKHFWAAGTYSNGANTLPFFDLWNGTAWRQYKLATSVQAFTKAPSPVSSVITSVTALSATNAWAVGYYVINHTAPTPSNNHTFAAHWNGSTWQPYLTPNRVSDATANELISVTSRVVGTSKQIYAVGRYFAGPMDQTLVLQYVTTPVAGWVKVTSANQNTLRHNELEGIGFVPGGGAVSVGTFFTGTSDRTLIESCPNC